MSTQASTEIIEFLATTSGRWVRTGEVSSATGVTDPADFRAAIIELSDCDLIDTEIDPLPFRVSPAERALAPMIGGEPRHLVRWIN